MNRPPEIVLNRFQLNVLLNEEEKDNYRFLLNYGVFCVHCEGICEEGVDVLEIKLTPLNDIMIHGICKVCKGKVTRIMEFGDDKAFYERAIKFRNALQN